MPPEHRPRILVVDGNPAEANAAITRYRARPYGEAYADVLHALAPGVSCVIVNPCEQGSNCLPKGTAFSEFDGVAWTGSALHVYEGGKMVDDQIRLARDIFDAGLPVFGSCWGMQLCVTALGGKVRNNAGPRELGVAESITLTDAGKAHSMMHGRPLVFSALTAHLDEIEMLPPNAQHLAGNPASDIQALSVEAVGVNFWGVQYHPEMNHATLAAIMRRLKDSLLREGMYSDSKIADAAIDQIQTFDDPERPALHGIYAAPELRTVALRAMEIKNWLHRILLVG